MNKINTLDTLITRFQKQKPIRASSLVITLYGDAIEPHGGTVWLGSLIKLLEPMGINERLMRTTIFRLTQDGWLTSDKVGRKSYYSLTGSGRRKFEQAFRRVYSTNQTVWDGSWSLIMTQQLTAEERKQLLDDLSWQGFVVLTGQLLGSPNTNLSDINTTLISSGLQDKVIVFRTHEQEELAGKQIRMLVRECWELDKLGAHYQEFITLFRPVWQELDEKENLDPESCFLTRTLLIHEYRKLLLRDPLLPEELLPGDWEGRAARQLCRNIYRKITPAAEKWLGNNLESADGPLPEASQAFYQRFGGLN
ncbi:phenylacetic acid degradation operon negative regulatory protein PaaX [Marinomonas piezotolerans]|uniref:Phenylacetic acid degradation operon negative regulatory protein PaaX n=1 Tax=Marinomonas piezotolerans TaxID=2213058 RepID=A0A370UCW1_9GAMM|nr:phenylacetic acid degradation operon negative regulatory protein PaaX [Marinomonas piezotolerans]RDL45633.1 phenylacetic acid degradation operon negative regulatory protein PaaX [Marinomonas piezotolerans]